MYLIHQAEQPRLGSAKKRENAMNDFYMIDEDDIARIEGARGCSRCELYEERLSGCPYWCAKWSINTPEEERSWRDKMIVEEHEKRKKK